MRRMLSDRLLMVVEEMPNRRVAGNQHELLCRRALTEGLEQPEKSLDCHVHYGSESPWQVAKCDMRPPRIARSTQSSVLPLTNLYSIGLRIVRLRHNALAGATRHRGSEQPLDERLTIA